MTTEQLIMTHIVAIIAGAGAAYAWLVGVLGYVHPFFSKVQADIAAIMAQLNNRPAAASPPVQAPPEPTVPTTAPAGPPKA